MALISTTTKSKAGLASAKALAKRPQLLVNGAKAAAPAARIGFKVSRPMLKSKARKRADQLEQTARKVGEALAVYGPQTAYELGLAEPPKPKRTAPRVAAGVIIGASAVYFLEPGQGGEHRRKVAELVG
jgi:gas vesicle protein